MKHQALARVFAVVLAILCLLLLATGVRGFGKADEELAERRAWEEKYAERIRSYVELEAELAGSISYEEAQKELEKRLEQHESDASQHRTDTALHTAEKGGNQMGADLIWEAMPELQGAKGDLEEAKRQLAEKERIVADNRATIDGTVQMANNGARICADESARLGRILAELAALAAQMVPPEQPQMPAIPVEVFPPGDPPTEPAREDFRYETIPDKEPPVEPGEEADDVAWEAYRRAAQAYAEELEAYNESLYQQAVEDYPIRKKVYEEQSAAYERYKENEEEIKAGYEAKMQRYEADIEEYYARLEAYNAALPGLQARYQMTAAGAMSAAAVVQEQGTKLIEAAGNLSAILQTLGQDAGGSDAGGVSLPSMGQDPEEMIRGLQAVLGSLSSGFSQISAGFGAIDGGLAEARNKVFEGELALKKAEAEIQDRLANIWYNLGELEKEAEQLAEEKETLDREASVLSKKILENEALKDLTNRRNSARQLLLNVAEVKSESAGSGDLPGAAEGYLERYRSQTQALDEGRRRVNVLAILAAAAGLLGIPGAFELTKKRVLLLAPVLLCLGFAAGADWLHVSLGFGQMYAALFTAIFAAVQLLIVLPKKKTIA